MLTEELVFEAEKIENLIAAIEEVCLSCEGIGSACSECPTDEIKKQSLRLPLITEKELSVRRFENISEIDIKFDDLIFDKNRILLAQNAIEEICCDCKGLGILCRGCKLHSIRRNLSSLPVIDSEPIMAKKTKKSSSGKGCGTSCSTGCSTKRT
jgi:hypothetical protein